MRRMGILVAIAVVATACGGGAASEPSRSPSVPPTTGATPTSPTVAPTSTAPSPVELPRGTPDSWDLDVTAADLDASSLIPRGTDVEEAWVTDDPEGLVIAYVRPGGDPFRAERGTLVWRRFDTTPAWRAVAWFPTAAESGVLGVDGIVADVTGDGRQDVLIGAFTGGSGACARWSVIDVRSADEVFGRNLCDGRIDPSIDPAGLSVDQAVYRPGDPHCCPSAFRTTVLTYDGDGTWSVASKEVRAAA